MFTQIIDVHKMALSTKQKSLLEYSKKTYANPYYVKYVHWLSDDSGKNIVLNKVSDESPYKNMVFEIPTLKCANRPHVVQQIDHADTDRILKWLKYFFFENEIKKENPLSLRFLLRTLCPDVLLSRDNVKISTNSCFVGEQKNNLRMFYSDPGVEMTVVGDLSVCLCGQINKENDLVLLEKKEDIPVLYSHPWENTRYERFISIPGPTLCCMFKAKKSHTLIPLTMLTSHLRMISFISRRGPDLVRNLRDLEVDTSSTNNSLRFTSATQERRNIFPHDSKFRLKEKFDQERAERVLTRTKHVGMSDTDTVTDLKIQTRMLLEAVSPNNIVSICDSMIGKCTSDTSLVNPEMYEAFSFMFR